MLIPSSPESASEAIDEVCEGYRWAPNTHADRATSGRWKQHRTTQMRRLRAMRLYVGFPILDPMDISALHEAHRILVARRRDCLLLISLRGHKDRYGDWPQNLPDIGSFVPATAVDPLPISGPVGMRLFRLIRPRGIPEVEAYPRPEEYHVARTLGARGTSVNLCQRANHSGSAWSGPLGV